MGLYVNVHILSAELLITFIPDIFSKMSFKTFFLTVKSSLGRYRWCHPPGQQGVFFAAHSKNSNKTQ